MKATFRNVINGTKMKMVFRRAALFLIVAIISFGLFEPGVSQALALESKDKEFKLDYDLKPLESDVQDVTKSVEQDGAPVAPNSLNPHIDNPRQHHHEDTSKRTAHSSTFVNNDGTRSLEVSTVQRNYKKGDRWEKIDNTLAPIEEIASGANVFNIPGSDKKLHMPSAYKAKAGVLNVSMNTLAQGLHLSIEGKNFTIKPVGANNSKPEKKNETTVIYREAWDGVDLEYEMRGELLKENIIVKSKNAATNYEFKVGGAKLIDDPKNPGLYTIEGLHEDFRFGGLTLALNDKGLVDAKPISQKRTSNNSIQVELDRNFIEAAPASSFPLTIDPSFGKWDQDNTDWMFKSDGFSCQGNSCWLQAGTLYDNGWKHWRTYVRFPYDELAGKNVLGANIHGYYNPYANPDPNQRYLFFGHANCIGWECRGTHLSTMLITGDFDVDVTNRLRDRVNAGDMGVVWSLWGEEVPYKTLKTYGDMSLSVAYDTPTPPSSQLSPAHEQVVVDGQPTLKGSTVNDADGATQYFFTVSTNTDGKSGAVLNSGWINSPQWTIPDGVLQDGGTYYWRILTRDNTQTSQNTESPARSFKIDFRKGKDATQTYDTVGPVGINLATGNATLEASSHTMNALGGTIGVGLNYDTPNRARKGLKAEYWNTANNYNFAAGVPAGDPRVVRIDPDINFDWAGGSPDSRITTDNWYTRWTSKMTVPATGAYTFGASIDDDYAIYINGNKVAGSGCCSGPATYANTTPINLTAGEVVDVRVEYREYVGAAVMKLFVKGAVPEQIVPREWFNTEDTNGSKLYGLTGRYYTDNTNAHDLDAAAKDPQRLMMVRQDTKMNIDFQGNGPAPGMQVDNFMARWTGYITVPSSGSYQIGAYADDGLRIKLNNGLLGAQNTLIDQWKDQATTHWSGNTHIDGNVQVPITIDWFEHGGGAAIKLLIRGNGLTEQEIPVNWLSPKANALPEGWQLNLDVDGNVAYERLRVAGNSVILEDASRQTHEYVSTGSGYKPPLNEDGVLVKNADATYTLTDVDGRVYIFDAEGKLKSVTTPADDRQPAALKYEYGNDPSRLLKISDGVSSARYATLHYKGIQDDNMCGHPAGFDDAPSGMLCALKSSDGDVTRFYYQAGQLARIEKPGNELVDYRYNTAGQIDTIRDSLASDVIAAGIRSNDDSATTKVTYDTLGRVNGITAPAASANASRLSHTFRYLPDATSAAGATQMHITGAPEPSGFSKRIEYDTLLRSTKVTDLAGKSTATEWDAKKDLQLSVTDATGLKSTTIYDRDDRPVDSYGPAPSEWFGADRRPSAAYVNQTPRTSTGFDEGINGPAVTYMAIKPRTSSIIPTGASLSRGQNIVSTDGRFNFIYQNDGNVVLYGPSGPIWDNKKTGVASDRLVMQSDGNLVQYNGSTPIWASNTGGWNNPFLRVQSDGNVVIYNSSGSIWSTNTGGQAYTVDNPTSLIGTPLLNRTNLTDNSTKISSSWTSSPIPGGSNYWGARMTGKLRLPTTGNWTFRIVADSGVRMSIDDKLVIDNWKDGVSRSHPSYVYNNTNTGSSPRLAIDYYHLGGSSANFTLYITPPGQAETSDVAQYISPGYNLTTSNKVYDSQLGDVETKTVYKDPAYGLVDKTILDPSGLNYEAKATYETPGTGYLRQTSETLPGGMQTSYLHYGANDTIDNPCTSEAEAFRQAGRTKGKIETDPDGSGPESGRKSETIYNESGDVVATRFNNDAWTCIEYDARGRVTKTTVPGRTEDNLTAPGRIITNNYALNGNPLVSTTSDNTGAIIVENDLVGNTVKYTDASGSVTENEFDTFGKLLNRKSAAGIESFEYDSYDRVIKQKLDTVTFAEITYDQYGRVQSVKYADGISLEPAQRDSLGRVSKVTYKANDQYITDEVQRSASGIVRSGVENGVTKSYTYDKASRLIGAAIGSDTFAYEFGSQDPTCSTTANTNINAGKDSNRTKLIRNGQATVYCYDQADRLLTSSDPRFKGVTYDSHGNTLSIGDSTHNLKFEYDANDRNTRITEAQESASRTINYKRDVQDRIIGRESKVNGSVVSNETHVYSGTGSSPSAILNENGDVVYKYVSLIGGVNVKINPASTSAGAKTFSLANIHGDTMATVNADGLVTGIFLTGPFGEMLNNTQTPLNASLDTTYGYVGSHQKITESSLITPVLQMGARAYLPELGRFMQVDPVEGGTLNNYVYAMDPVNQWDLDGERLSALIKSLVKFIKNPREFVQNIRPYNYRPAPIPKGQPAPRARDIRIPVSMPKVINPKIINNAERIAVNTAIKSASWMSKNHQTINRYLSDPRFEGWTKRACWTQASVAGSSYLIEVHYNINMNNNAADDFKVKSWSNYKPNGTGAKYPC